MAQVIEEATGVVLAGGLSRRFGSDKALAAWNGRTLLESVVGVSAALFAETLVVTKDPARLGFAAGERVRVVADEVPARHPLSGLLTALERARTRHTFVCACDAPFLQPRLVRALWEARADYDAVVPVWRGLRQPLCALYSKDCSAPIAELMNDPCARAVDLFDVVRSRFLLEAEVAAVDPEGLSFRDIDTRADYADALRLVAC